MSALTLPALIVYAASSPPLAFAAKVFARCLGCSARAVAGETALPPADFYFCFWQGLPSLPQPGTGENKNNIILLHYLPGEVHALAALLARSPGSRVLALLGDSPSLPDLASACGAPYFILPFACPLQPLTPLAPPSRQGAFVFGPAASKAVLERGEVAGKDLETLEVRSVSFVSEKEAGRLTNCKEKIIFLGQTPLGQVPWGEDLLLTAPFLAVGACVVWAVPGQLSEALQTKESLHFSLDFEKELKKFGRSLRAPQGAEAEISPQGERKLDLALYGADHMWKLARRTWPKAGRIYATGYSSQALREVARVLEKESPFIWAAVRDPVPLEELGKDKLKFEARRFEQALSFLIRQYPGAKDGAIAQSFSQLAPGVELLSRSHLSVKGQTVAIWDLPPDERQKIWRLLSLPVSHLLDEANAKKLLTAPPVSSALPVPREKEFICICSQLRAGRSWVTPEGERELALQAGKSAREKYPRAKIFLLDFSRPDLGDLDQLSQVFDAILLAPIVEEKEQRNLWERIEPHICLRFLLEMLQSCGSFSRFVKLDWRYSFLPSGFAVPAEKQSLFLTAGPGQVRTEVFSLQGSEAGVFISFLRKLEEIQETGFSAGEIEKKFYDWFCALAAAEDDVSEVGRVSGKDFWGVRGLKDGVEETI